MTFATEHNDLHDEDGDTYEPGQGNVSHDHYERARPAQAVSETHLFYFVIQVSVIDRVI
jgi:hypothetical protein